jgi:hypothetical protein
MVLPKLATLEVVLQAVERMIAEVTLNSKIIGAGQVTMAGMKQEAP